MTTTSRLWILGASDPEMVAIERLLTDAGERFAYAVTADGKRVHPGNAYRAAAPGGDCDETVYLVECGWGSEATGAPGKVVTIDHHRPGDPGYDRPVSEFLAASSIGQVVTVLAGLGLVDVPTLIETSDILMVAASDHCPAAAYQGECPGVDSDELTRFRAETRAAFQKRSVAEVMADVESARVILRVAMAPQYLYPLGSPVTWDEQCNEMVTPDFADLRDRHVPELPEAALREGLAYVTTVTEPGGRVKDVLGGHASPELVQSWMDERKAEGRETYGVPSRNYAGSYRKGGIMGCTPTTE